MPADPKRLIECEVNRRLIFRSINAERFAPGPTRFLYPTRLEYKPATVFLGLADEAGRSGISHHLSDRDFMCIPQQAMHQALRRLCGANSRGQADAKAQEDDAAHQVSQGHQHSLSIFA